MFIKHISLENSSTLSEKLFQFPGFYLRKLSMRDYPSNVATHLIGYLGEVDLQKTKEDKYYTKGDLSGVSGVEAAYEKDLRKFLNFLYKKFQGLILNGKMRVSDKKSHETLAHDTNFLFFKKYLVKLL